MLARFVRLFTIGFFSLAFLSSFRIGTVLPWIEKHRTNKQFSPKKDLIVSRSFDETNNDFFLEGDSLKIINGTFLGNNCRNYYGDSLGTDLDIIWRAKIGQGKTICVHDSVETWMGAGWTGQPLMVEEKGNKFLIQGCYDHKLKKINALSGEIIWEYPFDDVIKGTGTLYFDKEKKDLLIMQGSRIGFNAKSWQKNIFSYRAVSYFSGQEAWRMNVKRGASYSRDVDGSALVLNDTGYIGLENGYFTVFDPRQKNASFIKDSFQTKIISEEKLFNDADKKLHGGELVTESSPCKIGNHLYITSGSGHVYGFNLATKKIDWDFYVGSDLDGSPVVTNDSCLIVTIEKQFIKGRGGAMKIDPSKPAENCVVWFFPTGDKKVSDWKGGIIGSAAVSKSKRNSTQLCAFVAIDGLLYVVDQNQIDGTELVYGPDSVTQFPKPKIIFQARTGPSISTPLIIGNRIVVAGYGFLKIFEFDQQYNFTERASFKGFFESTPFVHRGRVYIASRGGYLYCFGKNPETNPEL
jgi:outer membrane protein assembly factor BamB